jgi:outer membrane protein
MFQPCKYAHMFRAGCRQSCVALAAWALFSGVVAAQDLSAPISNPVLSLPASAVVPLRVTYPPLPGAKANNGVPLADGFGKSGNSGGSSFALNSGDAPADVRRITLDEAQQLAGGASNPLVRLAELQVRVAKEHRLGVQSLYFPNISGQFENLHLNKFPGEVLAFQRRLSGAIVSVPVNIISKDQTAFNFSAVQPITPLLAVQQLVKIARADENIARAKAGMPVAETASKVEKNYFDLLIAERELVSADADTKKIQVKWLSASNSGAPSVSSEQEADMMGAEKKVVLAASKVKEFTASLNDMLGLPVGTRLELVPPEPLVEDTSLNEAVDKAGTTNAEVIEAEQTAVKARAGSTLSKMQYFPSVAIIGGYTNQTALNVVLPRDFSYVGFMATYTVFDFGKRERGVKESNAQAEMAEMGVSLTKAKVTAEVKSSYFELERSRKLSQLARRMVSAAQVVEASYQSDNPEVEPEQAKMEADMFRAELEYRQAYARLKSLMGDK